VSTHATEHITESRLGSAFVAPAVICPISGRSCAVCPRARLDIRWEMNRRAKRDRTVEQPKREVASCIFR
jgi:hypothetical protein